MKVKIESARAAKMFSCEVGDYRDLQRQDAVGLIDSKDVSDASDAPTASAPKPAAPRKGASKPAASRKGASKARGK